MQRRVTELAREQAGRGHCVTVLAPSSSKRSQEIDGVLLRSVRCRSNVPWRHIEFQARCAALLAQARAAAPEIVHVHNEPEFGLVCSSLRVPSVLSYDNFYFRRGRLRSAIRRSLVSYRSLLPVSNYCRDASIAHWRFPPDRVRVLPNGVNISQFAPDPAAAARERERYAHPVILYLGRICRQKGIHTLLQAARLLPGLGVRAHVLLAGPIGEFEPAADKKDDVDWRSLIDDSGAEYIGRVADSRLSGLLTMADVFVMPTIELEMQGMAALEAQACGTPVVASNQGGLPETVPAGCGALVPPGDAHGLARELARLIGDDQMRRGLSEAALSHAQSLSWARIVDRLEPIYHEAASSN